MAKAATGESKSTVTKVAAKTASNKKTAVTKVVKTVVKPTSVLITAPDLSVPMGLARAALAAL